MNNEILLPKRCHKLWKRLLSRVKTRFFRVLDYSHSLNPEKPKALQYQGFWLFLFLLFRIMFRRIEAFLKFPKTNRNQVKLFFFANPCSLNLCSWCRGVAAVCGGSANYDFKIRTEEVKSWNASQRL